MPGPPPGARPRRETAKRRRGRPVAFMVGVTVLLAAAFGGGLATAGDWVGQKMVEVIAPSAPDPPQPTKQRQQKEQERKTKQRDGQLGQRTG